MRPELDDGPIVMQAAVPVLPDDTADSLAARVLAQEHRIYPARCGWWPKAQWRSKANGSFLRTAGANDGLPVNPPLP